MDGYSDEKKFIVGKQVSSVSGNQASWRAAAKYWYNSVIIHPKRRPLEPTTSDAPTQFHAKAQTSHGVAG
jgi:hypothetical protein